MTGLKIMKPGITVCIIAHLALFFAASGWYLPSGAIPCMLDQLTETFEFIFSLHPLENAYMLSNPTAEARAWQLIATFFITAIPSYTIGYSLCLRYFNKEI
jgi:hypothetical protein